jgi:endonuclease YncB( thermonuclease family)
MPAILVQWILLSFLLPLCIPALVIADFSGGVVSVLDGDTIEVLHNNRAERIRLNGIDCPEKGQACGKRAKQAAQSWSLGRKSRFRVTASISTGAPLRMCTCPIGLTSITRWSKRAGVGGIRSMRRVM